jgi:hypothetical protein
MSQPHDAANSWIDAAADHDPWMTAMRRGEFAHAWRICDAHLRGRLARRESKHQGPRHLQSIWDGTPLAGKRVLVRCYHGLGDTVQFIRFAAPLRRLAREVTVWAQPQLSELIASAAGVARVLPLHDGTPQAAFDCDIEIMELAHALRVDARSIACPVPYLFPPPRRLRFAKPRDELSVGLVWHAGEWDPRRSLAGGWLSPLSRVSGVRLFSLQCGPAKKDAADIPAHAIACEDVVETAAALRALDLLITVDTFVAHLGGALGIPVWLLLHARCDWRWMEGREDSVWYPTMRLFRQTAPADWHQVVDSVATGLKGLVARRASREECLEPTRASDVRLL